MNPFEGMTRADIALELCCKYGFSVIPLREKKPLVAWAQYMNDAADEATVEAWWKEWPDANVGIVCGVVSDLVVFDCDDDAAAAWARENLPGTPFTVRTGKGWHLYYHHPGAAEVGALKRLREEIHDLGIHGDLQADTRYVVGPGSVHPTGAIYTACAEAADAWELAVEFNTVHPSAAKISLENLDLSRVRADFTSVAKGGRHDHMVRYAGRLIAEGLKQEDTLREAAAHNAAMCNPPLSMREIRSIVFSTYRTHDRNHPGQKQAAEAMTDMAGVRIITPDEAAEKPWPDELTHPGGLLERLIDYSMASSVKCNRVFGLAGALSLMGVVLSQRIRSQSGLTTNFYVVSIGASGAGKDSPRKMAEGILCGDGDMANAYGGADIASDVSVLSYMQKPNCRRALFVIDEIGLFLQSVKKPTSPRAGIIKLMTELFSRCGSPYIKRYASSENDKALDWHAFSVYGMSVPGEFWNALCDGEATNGFLARALIFESLERNEYRGFKNILLDVPDDLRAAVRALWEIRVPGEDAPLDGTDISKRPVPHIIRMDDDADAFHDRKAREYSERENLTASPAEASIFNRAAELAMKVSLVRAASEYGPEVVGKTVSLGHIQWAWRLVEECQARAIEQICLNIHSTDFEALTQQVVRFIGETAVAAKRKGKDRPGASLAEISRALKGSNIAETKAVLDKLAQSNRIRLQIWPPTGAGRKTELYCLCEEVGDDGN